MQNHHSAQTNKQIKSEKSFDVHICTFSCAASLISCILAKWLMNPNGNVHRGNANFAPYNEQTDIRAKTHWVHLLC